MSEEPELRKYLFRLTNGRTYEAAFPHKNNLEVKTWLNDCKRFISIGEYTIINLDHVVDIELVVDEDEDE